MNAARHCSPGAFRVQQKAGTKREGPLAECIQLSSTGMSFVSSAYLGPLTEVQVCLHFPGRSGSHLVTCPGVVVECRGTRAKSQYRIAVAFLNHPLDLPDEPGFDLHPAQTRVSAAPRG